MLALASTLAVTVLPFIPDGGLRELYDRTLGYQASRGSPFSIWGQVDLGLLHTLTKVGAVGLALLVAFVPRRAGDRQVAALGAAVLIALQLPRQPLVLPLRGVVPAVRAGGELRRYRVRRHQQLANRRRASVRAALNQYRVQPRVFGRGLEAHLRERQEALDRLLRLTPITPPRGPVMPTSLT